jgi:putative Mg2+ transporter-C (MgtC) family protein
MGYIPEWEIVTRLLISAILSGLIGLERESHARPAGLRTHILVGLGSCLIMVISVHGFPQDPARLAAQVVSGIGFLGAGTILREGLSVRGLTTAASLWVVSGIGLSVGMGLHTPALAVTTLSVLILVLLEKVEKKIFYSKSRSYHLEIRTGNLLESVPLIFAFISQYGWTVHQLDFNNADSKNEAVIVMAVGAKDEELKLEKDLIISELLKIPGVIRVKWK